MTEQQVTIIKALADCDLNISKTAKKIYFHRSTVLYHADKIKKETGLDPRNFYDLIKLLGTQEQKEEK